MPTVAIIIPTYNRSRFLADVIENVKRAASDAEIILVDDGSTDDTLRVCESLAGIRYIRLPCNQGLAAARNAGIRSTSAEFVAFVDDDDLRLRGSIDLQIGVLQTTPNAAVCYGRMLLADSKNRLPTGQIFPLTCPSGDIFWDLLEGLFPVSIVARRQALLESGLFNPELRRSEDWDLWLRMAQTHRFVAVSEPVAVYRQANLNSGQICSDAVLMCRQMLSVQQAALKLPRALRAPSRRRRQAHRRLLKLAYDDLRYEAQRALENGDRHMARSIASEALRLRPIRARGDLSLRRLLRVTRSRRIVQHPDSQGAPIPW